MISEFEIKDNVLIKYHGKDAYIMIPDGITRIGEYAFCNREQYCTGIRQIKGVYIPEGVVSIGHSAFRNCSRLERVSLPKTLVRIESFAFRHAPIKELEFPDNLRYCNEDFYYYSLEKISYRGVTFSPKYQVEHRYQNHCYQFDRYINVSHMLKLLRTDKAQAMQILLEAGQEQAVMQSLERFISRKNIDRLIQIAIEKKAYQLQMILTDYKYQHVRFRNIGENLKL